MKRFVAGGIAWGCENFAVVLAARCRAFAVFEVLLALSSMTASRAADPEPLRGIDDRWHYYSSPNFELYSRNGDKPSRALLHNLETLRAVCIDRFKLTERTHVGVTVYYFQPGSDFRAYAPATLAGNVNLGGFYISGPDRAVIALPLADDAEEAQHAIFHEYVHHLFRSAEEDPPTWINEGMAELFASIRSRAGALEIGYANEGSMQLLRRQELLPLEQLFAVNENSPIYRSDSHAGLFYAEAWALLHYWQFGRSDLPAGAAARFLALAGDRDAANAADLRAKFRECFGMDYPQMQRRLERYVESGSYGVAQQPEPEIAAATTYATRPVDRDEIELRLAELALRVTGSPAGKQILVNAAARQPTDARVLEALGAAALAEGDKQGAAERWEQAIAAGSTNPALSRELATLEFHQLLPQFDSDVRLSADDVQRLRQYLRRAIAGEPQQGIGYQMLAWVEAFAERPSVENVVLVQEHFAQIYNKPHATLALALMRVHTGQFRDATALLDQLDKMQPQGWTRQVADVVRKEAENGAAGTVGQAALPASAPTADAPTSRSGVNGPAAGISN
jgi:hypothetical protein